MTNLQDITLQSPDGILVATNDNGHLVYPMLHLDRQPVPADAQGFDRILVFVDGDERPVGGGQFVFPLVIHLNEDNDYSYPMCIHTEHEWLITVEHPNRVSLPQQTGTGDTRLNVGRNASLTPGTYETQLHVAINDGNETMVTVQVILVISRTLVVNNISSQHNVPETLRQSVRITLNAANDLTQTLTLQRDREWTLEPRGSNNYANHISVIPSSGNSDANLVVTSLVMAAASQTTVTTTFRVTSHSHWVDVIVTIVIPQADITGEFADPRPGEDGVTGTEDDPVYIYI
jgi:hypothetical protein